MEKRLVKQVTALIVVCILTVCSASCGRVIESSEEYVPISQTQINPVSYSFASVDYSSQETSLAALGDYLDIYNESTRTQRVYSADANGVSTLIAELPSGDLYEIGPMSLDTSKLFLYRKDPDAVSDSSHYYGGVLNLLTGELTLSASPMFELGTVNWAGNDLLFTANRRILFFSASDLTVQYSRFDIAALIENDPDGKYVLTGMVYDRNADRYLATVCEKIPGASELSELYKTKLMIAVIDAQGRTEKTFYVPDGLYAPVNDSTGLPLAQNIQVDSYGNVAVYASFYPTGSSEPLISWIVINIETQAQIPTTYRLRDGVIRGGWIYGLTIEPYSAWWTDMSVVLYSPASNGKYNFNGVLFTQPSDFRYISTAGFSASTTYEMFLYPDGNLLLKAYHNESGYSRIILYNIDPNKKTYVLAGALPAKSNMKYMVGGVEAGGKIVFMSDY